MRKNRSKRAKKCKVCGKILRDHNKSGFCSHHYRIKKAKEIKKKRKENKLCINCGKKVELTILYPAGKTTSPIIKLPIRCYACTNSAKNRQQKMKNKRKKDHLCVQCGKKVEPMILYPSGKTVPPIIKYPIRCYACRTKYKKSYLKKQKDKQKK